MNSIKQLLALIILTFGAISYSPGADATNSIPAELRFASFSCDKPTIKTAVALKHEGWTYIMPEPKSPQAAWGNPDRRTTWWVGFWVNGKTSATSSKQPTKDDTGEWVGDDSGGRAWRRGGTPPPPTKIQWLCSSHGGVPPD
jgi:hypothetical protein